MREAAERSRAIFESLDAKANLAMLDEALAGERAAIEPTTGAAVPLVF